jgi:hypothetical protein
VWASGGAGVDAMARPAAGGDGGALCLIVLLVPCSNRFFSKKLNRTGPSDEYQSCRSSYQQQFLQKPYRVFLPRSKVICMPILNVSRVGQTVNPGLQGISQVFPLKI